MKDIVLISENGIEIYQSDIDILTEEYISSLQDETMIYKSMPFNGLLYYIYIHKIKHIIDIDKQNRKDNHNNYKLLNDIFFNIFLPVCYKFNNTPTVLQFCSMVMIDNSHLSDIRAGFYRGNGSRVNPEHTQIVKKWFDICENGLSSKTINEGSIGSMFILKSKYHYVEASPEPPTTEQLTQSTPEQIAERYRDAKKPEIPILD